MYNRKIINILLALTVVILMSLQGVAYYLTSTNKTATMIRKNRNSIAAIDQMFLLLHSKFDTKEFNTVSENLNKYIQDKPLQLELSQKKLNPLMLSIIADYSNQNLIKDARAVLNQIKTLEHDNLAVYIQKDISMHRQISQIILTFSIISLLFLLFLATLINNFLVKKVISDTNHHDQHQLLESILNCMGDGVVVQDMQKNMILINPEAVNLMGDKIDEVKLYYPDGNQLVPENEHPRTKALAGMSLHNDTYLMKGPHNSDGIFINVSMRPLFDSQGKPKGSVAVMRDITEAKKLYDELESFSYSVSHDLRAPLRSIMGFSQIMLEAKNNENLTMESQDALKRIIGATRKMGEVIDGLLTLSRLTRTEIAKEKIDLSLIAYWIAADLQALEPSRNIKFIIPKNITANGDSRLLMIAMTNLMNNAYKFTSLKTETTIEFGHFKETYFIRDNGAGFDMRHVAKLFAPFQRLHGTNHFPGSGIGLATVKRIIQRHSGTIWAEAEVNKGATFYFTL